MKTFMNAFLLSVVLLSLLSDVIAFSILTGTASKRTLINDNTVTSYRYHNELMNKLGRLERLELMIV